jgi:hypothetical protein
MQQTLKVQAVLRDGQAKLYPAGRPGAYLGWRECLPEEEAEHVVPGAPSTGDGFKQGKDVRYTRKASPGSQDLLVAHVPYDRDMRKALADGCIVQVCDKCSGPMAYGQQHACTVPTEPPPALSIGPAPTAPRLPRGGR